mgnify:CR=1 FL=1
MLKNEFLSQSLDSVEINTDYSRYENFINFSSIEARLRNFKSKLENIYDAINNGTIVEKTVNDVYQVNFDYLVMNDIMRIVKEEQLSLFKPVLQFNSSIYLTILTRLNT